MASKKLFTAIKTQFHDACYLAEYGRLMAMSNDSAAGDAYRRMHDTHAYVRDHVFDPIVWSVSEPERAELFRERDIAEDNAWRAVQATRGQAA